MIKFIGILCIISFSFYNVQSQQVWSLNQYRPALEFSDIEFLDAGVGFVFADSSIGAIVLKTNDGGQTWSTYELGNPDYSIEKAFFLNASEGYAVGRNGGGNNGLFIKTLDGGATWVNPASFSERVYNVCFLNSNTGWVMGKNNLFAKTSDGGANWTNLNVTGEDITAMKFFNATQGVMICDGGEIYITSDAGITWNSSSSGVSDDLTAIAVKNNSAWVCGEAGTLLYSSDYGQTWTIQSAASSIDFNDISFADGSNGYVAGVAGIINQTTNAGNVWQNQNSNCPDEIVGISVPDNNHGWFCSENSLYSFVTAPTGLLNVMPHESLITVTADANCNCIRINGDASEITEVKIMDMNGKIHLQQNLSAGIYSPVVTSISLMPGIYVAEVTGKTKRWYSKFIKSY